MSDRRRGAVGPSCSPPPRPSAGGRDRAEENWRFSHSYRSPLGLVQPEHDCSRPPLVSEKRDDRRRYAAWSPLGAGVPDPDEIGRHRLPACNRSETDRSMEAGSVQWRRDYDELPKDFQLRQQPSEYLRKDSTFAKFEWQKLMADDDQLPTTTSNANTNAFTAANPTRNKNPFDGYYDDKDDEYSSYRKIGGFSGVVPTPATTTMEISRVVDPKMGHGFVDYGNSRRISSESGTHFVDSGLDRIAGNNNHGGALFTDSVRESSSRMFDALRESHSIQRGGKVEESLSFGADHLSYGREMGLNREELQWVGDCGLKRDGVGAIGSSGNGFGRLPKSYEEMYATERSPQRFLMEDDLNIHEHSDMGFRRKCSLEREASDLNHNRKCCCRGNAIDDEVYNTGDRASNWSNEDMEAMPMPYLDDSGLRHFYGEMYLRSVDGMMMDGISNSDNALLYSSPMDMEKHARMPVETSRGDIKSRLGLRLAGSVKNRLGVRSEMHIRNVKAFKPDIRHRLELPRKEKSSSKTRKSHKILPWMQVSEGRGLEHFDGMANVQEVESSEVKLKKGKKDELTKIEPPEDSERREPMKTEPPEGSVEFMQLVQSAFLKYVKVLNENSAKRRKYMEQGGRGPFKCGICGSSKEFRDTASLAQHAFTSCKVGTRSEHLGFHKALCALMGWTSAEVQNGLWVRKAMTDVEAVSSNEDLIIWPPVVIVHNSSIAHENPNDRMIVSIEGLRDTLRGMGFGQGITNICRGKPANQSTMVVIFKGTFLGLQEAERLHKLYVKNKHGRTEFQQVGCRSSDGPNAETQADHVESFLYGYLGISTDLDKLDYQTKPRCVVKSKKEIDEIANASLGTL